MWTPVPVKEAFKIQNIFSMFSWLYPPNYAFDGEAHDFWECVYVISGSICAVGGERICNLRAGDLIFHQPMEFHKLHVLGDKPAKIFIFSCSMQGENTAFFRNKSFHLMIEQQEIINALLAFLGKKTSGVHVDYLSLLCSSPIVFQQAVTYLYQLLLSLCEQNQPAVVSENTAAEIYRTAVHFMNSAIAEPLTVEEIAKHCNISVSALKRIFHRFAGLSVHKYFLQLKINAATQLLKNGENVTSIAEHLGFGSQAYFSFVFKRETGLSPTSLKQTK